MMNAAPTLTEDAARLLREAVEWRLFGLLFEYPSGTWRSNVEALLPSLPADLSHIAGAALADFSEGLHIALFGPSGSVPVREVAHKGGVQFGYLMAELSAYYEAFGYTPETSEAVDHLSVQLGFMAFLKMKEAQALMSSQSEPERLTAEAAATFLAEHVAVQAEPVLHALENFGSDFLVEAGRRILERAGPAPRSGYPLGSTGVETDDEDMSCGPSAAGEDFIQLQP